MSTQIRKGLALDSRKLEGLTSDALDLPGDQTKALAKPQQPMIL
jgi:hypothetical protein